VKGFRFPLLQRSCGLRVWRWRNHVVVGFRVERRPKVAFGNLGLEAGTPLAFSVRQFRSVRPERP